MQRHHGDGEVVQEVRAMRERVRACVGKRLGRFPLCGLTAGEVGLFGFLRRQCCYGVLTSVPVAVDTFAVLPFTQNETVR